MSIRPNESTIRQRVWTLVEPVCADAGYDLVDVRFVTEQNGWVLRVLIDVAPDEQGSDGRAAQRSAALAANAAHADDAHDDAANADDAHDDDAHGDDDADGDDDDDGAADDDSDDAADLEAAADAIGSLAPGTHSGSEGDIDLADCERISRELSAVLDVDDPITVPYSLEVSSPGIDRPLVTEAHFRRYAGAEIKATLHRGVPTPMGSERKNFRGLLAGVEGTGKDAHARVIVDGQPWLLPIDDVDHARIVPDWDDVMRGGRGQIRRGEAADAAAGTKHAHGKPGAHGKLPHPKAAEAAAAHAAKLAAEAAHAHGSKKKRKKDKPGDGAPSGSPDHDEPAGSQTTSGRDDDRAS